MLPQQLRRANNVDLRTGMPVERQPASAPSAIEVGGARVSMNVAAAAETIDIVGACGGSLAQLVS